MGCTIIFCTFVAMVAVVFIRSTCGKRETSTKQMGLKVVWTLIFCYSSANWGFQGAGSNLFNVHIPADFFGKANPKQEIKHLLAATSANLSILHRVCSLYQLNSTFSFNCIKTLEESRRDCCTK